MVYGARGFGGILSAGIYYNIGHTIDPCKTPPGFVSWLEADGEQDRSQEHILKFNNLLHYERRHTSLAYRALNSGRMPAIQWPPRPRCQHGEDMTSLELSSTICRGERHIYLPPYPHQIGTVVHKNTKGPYPRANPHEARIRLTPLQSSPSSTRSPSSSSSISQKSPSCSNLHPLSKPSSTERASTYSGTKPPTKTLPCGRYVTAGSTTTSSSRSRELTSIHSSGAWNINSHFPAPWCFQDGFEPSSSLASDIFP